MNLISIVILAVVAICFFIALKNIISGKSSCSGCCDRCMKNNSCRIIKKEQD